MATADLIDVPPMSTTTVVASATHKRKADDHTEAPNPKDRISVLHDRMRTAANWFPSCKGTTWTNVTRPGKSQRTLFILTGADGSQQFCTVGRVFSATLSQEALSVPSPYSDANSDHTDLQVHLSLRESSSDSWASLTEDINGSRDKMGDVRHSAIADAMVPIILGDDDKIVGIPDKKLKAYRKKSPEQLKETLDEAWGGTGMNESGDILRTKRRCYNTTDLTDSSVFMDKWLSVTDANGQPLNYINDTTAVERGDLVLMWFRVMAQATAGNFHVSVEPRSMMVLEKNGGGGGGREGSAAFAAALVKAMQRDDSV